MSGARFLAFVAVRLFVAGVCVLTAAYAVLNCTPFAFEMFIRPQLFPWVGTFVAWHHLWWAGAYVASLITVLPVIRPRAPVSRRQHAARVLAIVYATAGGAGTLVLVASPLLPRLWNDQKALPVALAAFIPLLWLAAIDHAAAPTSPIPDVRAVAQRRALAAFSLLAAYLWVVHLLRAVLRGADAAVLAWLLTGAWALSLTLVVAACAYATWLLLDAVATAVWQPAPPSAPAVVLLAGATCEFLRRVVLPTLSLESTAAATVSVVAGLTAAAVVSGIARRALPGRGAPAVVGPARRDIAIAVVALAALAAGTWAVLDDLERLDWAFVGQKLSVLLGASAAFAVLFRVARHVPARAWSMRAMVVPPAIALAFFFAVPRAALIAGSWTGQRALEPEMLFDRLAGGEMAFRFMADALLERAATDPGYDQFLRLHSQPRRVAIPDVDLAGPRDRDPRRRPHVFLFVIDSLRHDYLSPYNAEVGFTPSIDAFARDAFVYRNAFTRHGGTQLAGPSLWAGATTMRGVLAPGFDRMNALEKLVVRNGYRMAVNDFTVAPCLRPTTPVTRLEPDVPSVATDFCSNLDALESHLDVTRGDERPVFGYLSPMNVHILNTRRGGQTSLDGDYPGFYAPYASRVRRMDACFGEFIDYLRRRGLYENSIVIVTSDHGDSLGEDQYWGHGTWLFPEVVRVPLIVRVPASWRGALTTDLARVAFTADIAPTLYRLLGHDVREPSPIFGAPLIVDAGEPLADRRRRSFLLTSSYGDAYAVLRRNGRLLYITDLVEWREFAYQLSPHTGGAVPMPIDADLRHASRALIRAGVSEVAGYYSAAATPAAAATARRDRGVSDDVKTQQ